MKKYGSIIAKLRKKHGLTQEQLGTKLNVSYQAVSKWENNLSEPDLATIEKLADIFNITVSEFFDIANNPEKADNPHIKQDVVENKSNLSKSKFDFSKFIKSKPWYLVVGLTAGILILALIVALVPIKYSSSKIYKMVDPSVFCIKAEYSNNIQTGTGFFINDKGLAVTNYHVIEKCTSGEIQLNNGKIYNIKKVVGYNEDKDIAIIQIDIKKSKPVKLGNSNKVKVGETVYAIGYPQAHALGSMDSTLTQGIVSKKSYTIEGNTYIQTTADITNGNSGGVLVNREGKVIGITSAKITINGVASDYMNLAIPINKIKSVKKDFNGTLAQLAEKHGNHTVTFMSDGEVYATSPIAYNEKVSAKTITKTGYQFEGWHINSNCTTPFDFNQGIKVNTILYAKWKANTYIVRFNANGGKGYMADIICEYDKEYTLPNNTFTYAYCNYQYWIIRGTIHYPNITKFKNLTTTNNGIVEVKAYWEAVKYTITYTSSNELVPLGNREMKYYYTYYEEFNLPNITCTNNVYKFIGWTGEGITTPTRDVVIPKYSYGEKHFIAHWEQQIYKITYRDKNNKVLKSEEITREKFPYSITYYNPSGCYYFDNNLYSNIECTQLIISGENKNSYTLTTPMDFDVYINAYYTKNDFTYYSWEGGNKVADKYIGTDKNVYVPNNITKLYGSTFWHNANIENVYMSDSVTTMGYQVFMGSSVKYVKLSNNLTSIGKKCFYECTNLESVVLPDSLEEIGYYAFYNCTALKQITIPNKVAKLIETFWGCTSLENVILGSGLTEMWGGVFYECVKLKSITLPSSLIKLGNLSYPFGAFEKCNGLVEMTIPENVKYISSCAFEECANLEKVIILSEVAEIRNYVFQDCSSLKILVLSSGIASIGVECFENCTALQSIYYNGTKEQFEAIEIAKGNECFTNAQVYYFASEKPEEEGDYWYYDNDGNITVWEY